MDLLSVLRIPRIILTVVGRWPERKRTAFSVFREITSFLIEIIFKLFLVAELIRFIDDYDVIFDVLSVLITAIGHLVKILFFKIQSKVWLNLLDQLKSIHFNIYPKNCNGAIKKTVGFAKLFGHGFIFGCCCSSSAYLILPLFIDKDLPIRNSFVSGKYITYMYIFQIIVTFLCALSHAAIDVISIFLMAISVGQMNVLKEKIIHYGSEENKGLIDLGECVEHHNAIIHFVNTLDNAVRGIILVEYIKSMLVICFLGIQFVLAGPRNAPIASILVYFVVMLFQLAIYCFFGNEILVTSTEINDACYESSWYDFDKNTTSSLMLIMEQSKKPLFVTSGKFSIVSLQSLTSVIKASYSYFTLMQTLYNKSDISVDSKN